MEYVAKISEVFATQTQSWTYYLTWLHARGWATFMEVPLLSTCHYSVKYVCVLPSEFNYFSKTSYKKFAGVYLMYCFMDGLAVSFLVSFLALFRKIELIKEEKSIIDILMVDSIIQYWPGK